MIKSRDLAYYLRTGGFSVALVLLTVVHYFELLFIPFFDWIVLGITAVVFLFILFEQIKSFILKKRLEKLKPETFFRFSTTAQKELYFQFFIQTVVVTCFLIFFFYTGGPLYGFAAVFSLFYLVDVLAFLANRSKGFGIAKNTELLWIRERHTKAIRVNQLKRVDLKAHCFYLTLKDGSVFNYSLNFLDKADRDAFINWLQDEAKNHAFYLDGALLTLDQ